MQDCSFSLELVNYLFEHRTPAATALFQFFTYLGDIEGYVLVISVNHVAFDKRLALRLAVVVLVTMSVNHLLKILIANPRPFTQEASYAEKWAVTQTKAAGLATEYSTPSGHAMGGSAFYGVLFAALKRRPLRAAAIVTMLLSGLSRPYLGMHYFEDVLIGWALGIAIAVLVVKLGDSLGNAWNRIALGYRVPIVVAACSALGLLTQALEGSTGHGPPLGFVTYTGFLAGIVLGFPLEARWVGFDPASSSTPLKFIRCMISVALIVGTLVGLDMIFERIASDTTLLGMALRFVRYGAAALAASLLAPFLFVRLGLAETARP